MIKVAILLYYLRIVGGSGRHKLVKAIKFMIAEIIIYKSTYVLVVLLSCRPLPARWLRKDLTWATTHHHTCINESANLFSGSIIAGTEDLIISLMPTLFIWSLQIPLKQKTIIWLLFSIGVFSSFASYARAYFSYQIYEQKDYICESKFQSNVPRLSPSCVHHKGVLKTTFIN